LTQRSFKQETDPGEFTFLGEHVITGEGYEEAAKRGVDEELGFVPESIQEVQCNIFRLHGQTEFVRFFIVDWNGEKIKANKEEIIDIKWMTPELLVKQKSNYSEMTRYWVENINWNDMFPKK
jgi:isopentenyldiphosphate isomerase